MTDTSVATMTFLFSDIEGSTRLWELHGTAMEPVLALHDELASKAVTGAGGSVFKHTGDGLGARFPSPEAAVDASVRLQRALASTDWNPVDRLRARIGIHSGAAQHRAGDYFGRAVNRCARLMAVANGGQVVVSGTTRALVEETPHPDWELVPLGVHHLKDLSRPEEVFQVAAQGLDTVFPRLNTVDIHPRSLPAVRGTTVGRRSLLEDLTRRLDSDRLVTLVGPGGVGKSRVAIEAADHLVGGFPDGVWFCPVKGLDTTEQMAAAIADVLRIEVADAARTTPTVVAALGARTALLVVDGCEAGADAAADLIEEILDGCPTVKIVATTRERLRLRAGQQVVDPLESPDAGITDVDEIRASAAVRLFADRATAAEPDFAVTLRNAGAVAELCRRLDGLPLALELAAAQVATLDPADILTRLERDRGRVEGEGTSVDDIVAWAYDSLPEPHRRLFARLSVFDGGFDLAAAEAICADELVPVDEIATILTDLVDKSLLGSRRVAGRVRFWMLTLLRRFGAEQLAVYEPDRATVRTHCAHYRDVAQRCARGVLGRDEEDAVAEMALELPNVRAALRAACDTGAFDEAAEIVVATYPYAFGRTRYEIVEWARTVVNATRDGPGPLAPELMTIAAWGLGLRGDVDGSSAGAREALDVAARTGRDPWLPHRLLIVGSVLRGDMEGLAAEIAAAHDAMAIEPDPIHEAELLGFEAFSKAMAGDRDGARSTITTALERAHAVGNPSLIAWCLYESGVIDADHDDAAAAIALDDALELAELVDNRYIAGIVLMIRTRVAAQSDDLTGSLHAFSEMLSHWYRLANWANLTNGLRLFATFLADHGHDAAAARVVAGLSTLADRSPEMVQVPRRDETLSALEARLSPEERAGLRARTASLDLRGLVEGCQAEIARLLDSGS